MLWLSDSGAAPLISQEQNISVLLDVIFMPRCDYNKRLRMVTPLQERDLINSPPNFWVRDAQISFQMGGGRQCRNVLAQLLRGVYFESKAPTRRHEFALPRCCGCRAGNVRSAAECTGVHQPQWESLLRAFHPSSRFVWIDPNIYENKNEGCMEYFFFKILSASEWIN